MHGQWQELIEFDLIGKMLINGNKQSHTQPTHCHIDGVSGTSLFGTLAFDLMAFEKCLTLGSICQSDKGHVKGHVRNKFFRNTNSQVK